MSRQIIVIEAFPSLPRIIPRIPNAVRNEPNAIPDEPKAITRQPDACTDEPKAIPDEPNSRTDEPKAILDEPNWRTDEPDGLPGFPKIIPPFTKAMTKFGLSLKTFVRRPMIFGAPQARHLGRTTTNDFSKAPEEREVEVNGRCPAPRRLIS